MGIAPTEEEFLRRARDDLGVDFERTLTLCRQGFFGPGRSRWAEPLFEELGAKTVR